SYRQRRGRAVMDLHLRPAPYRIETERLVLRCPEVSDTEAAHEGVLESLDALRPWMPWVEDDPVSLRRRVDEVRRMRAGFDRGEDNTYFVFDAGDGGFLGGMGLHQRVGPLALELGYWIRTARQGSGLAGEGASALLRAAFDVMRAHHVEIRIEPENAASLRVVEKLGVPLEARLRGRFPRGGALRDIEVYTVFAGDFEDSPAGKVPVRLYDAVGSRIPTGAPEPRTV
ncbi:GNAT family N-acetyltransferase, partial [bacterium]|nr:GNAT family N-acetyltransferase [bacterium]